MRKDPFQNYIAVKEPWGIIPLCLEDLTSYPACALCSPLVPKSLLSPANPAGRAALGRSRSVGCFTLSGQLIFYPVSFSGRPHRRGFHLPPYLWHWAVLMWRGHFGMEQKRWLLFHEKRAHACGNRPPCVQFPRSWTPKVPRPPRG